MDRPLTRLSARRMGAAWQEKLIKIPHQGWEKRHDERILIGDGRVRPPPGSAWVCCSRVQRSATHHARPHGGAIGQGLPKAQDLTDLTRPVIDWVGLAWACRLAEWSPTANLWVLQKPTLKRRDRRRAGHAHDTGTQIIDPSQGIDPFLQGPSGPHADGHRIDGKIPFG